MSKKDPVDQLSPAAEALEEVDVATTAEEFKTKPAISAVSSPASSERRSKLALADSMPRAAFDSEVGSSPPPPEVGSRPEPSEGTDPYLGKTLADRYEVLTCLGRGSMGTVYSCRHRILDKWFAVKIIRQELARDAEAVSRFLTEAKAASAIGSKHIVEVVDFGELPDGAAYIVMERLAGQTLYQLLDQTSRLSISRALGIAIQITEALSAAHAAGVVHRDLKPDNVFLVREKDDPDFVKILDFGIAKVLSSGSKLTQAGSVLGTPAYMSPEQALGQPTDHRTDIYSLGVMLYEMAAGEVPFDAEAPLAVLSMQVSDPPPRLSERLPPDRLLPPGYEAVVEKCLAKRPEDRFQSMDEVKAALEKIAEGGLPDVEPRPSSLRPRRRQISVTPLFSPAPRPPARSKSWILPLIGLPALAIAGFLTFREAPPEPAAPVAASASPVASTPEPPPEPEEKPAAPASEDTMRAVHLILFPLDARVYDGKKDLGMMPVTVKLKPGEVKYLTIARRGYVPRRIMVDGSKSRVVVGLVAENAANKGPIDKAERAADEAAARAVSRDAPKPRSDAKATASSDPQAAKPAASP